MSLSNLNNAANIKSFVAQCYPKEVLVIEETHSGWIKKINYSGYIQSISVSSVLVSTKKNSLAELVADDQWYHDRANGVLYYYIQDEQVEVVVTFGFFFKTGDSEPLHVDINDASTDLVMYEGRMLETSFIQSIEDISNGTLAVSSTSISLINNDGFYQPLARDEISFKNSSLEVRIFYNDISNNSLVFTGSVESASFRSKEVILEAKDLNKRMQNTAKFTAIESEYKADATTYPDIESEAVGKEIPFMLGRTTEVSMEKILVDLRSSYGTSSPGDVVGKIYSWDQKTSDQKMLPWTNDTRTIDPALSAAYDARRRKFIAYRSVNQIKSSIADVTLYDHNIVKAQSYLPDGVSYFPFEVEIPVTDPNSYFVGQLCFWLTNINASESQLASFRERSNCVVSLINEADSRVRIRPTTCLQLEMLASDATGACYFYPVSDQLGTQPIFIEHTSTLVNSDHYLNCIYISNSVPIAPPEANELDVKDYACRFVTDSTNLSLGCMLHRTLIEAGYQTDGGTSKVLAAGTNSFRHLDTKLGTTYWTLHTGMVDTYLDLLQMMLSSVFAFMYVQSDGKVGVRLFENTPYNNTVWALSEDDIVEDSIISDFNSGGICSRLLSTNDTNNEFVSEYTTSLKRLLHGDVLIENQFHFESRSIYETKVMPRKYEYLSNSVRKFDFTIINTGYDILLGDRISVNFSQSNKWLGYPKQYDLFVIAVNKSLLGTTVTAIENIFPTL